MLRIVITTVVLCFVLISLVGCAGCCGSIQEPEFLTQRPTKLTNYNNAEQQKYRGLSDASAQSGWSYLSYYFNKTNLIPAFNRSYVANAMKNFNWCWSFNPENYQAYWGAGVVRGIQATFVEDNLLIEKYLKQSVEFMLMAMKHNFPKEQTNYLRLDLANAYNGLGAFYLRMSRKKLRDENLNKAETILLDILKQEPENGRAYFLLAATKFYQGDYHEAEKLIKQAQNKHFKVEEDFIKDVESKIAALPPASSSKSKNK